MTRGPLRACIVCARPFTPTVNNASRCPDHAIPRVSRDRTYRRIAYAVISNAGVCPICGQPARIDDPLVCDHRVPRALGGSDDRANLQAAHRSCNGRKSATLPGPYRGRVSSRRIG